MPLDLAYVLQNVLDGSFVSEVARIHDAIEKNVAFSVENSVQRDPRLLLPLSELFLQL